MRTLNKPFHAFLTMLSDYKSMRDFVNLLNEELESRKDKNPSYSLRAFAAFLEEHPSYLHKVIKRDIRITPRKVYKYCLKLGFNKKEICDHLLSELESNHESSGSKVISAE